MLATIITGMIVTALNQSVINVALPTIMTDLKITAATAQWLTTAFMLTSGILVPISAYLVQKFSYRQLFLAAMISFVAGSFLCAFSGTFHALLFGRVIQAIGSGILLPLVMNVFMFSFPVEKRGSAMGILGLGMILAPALGPTVAGLVLQSHTWNILFYGMAIIGAAVTLFAFLTFKFESPRKAVKLDLPGVALSTVGFGTLLYGISEIATKGWTAPEVLTLIGISIVTLFVLVIYSLKKQDPLLEMRVFKDFNFTYTMIVNTLLTIALYGGMLLLPIYLQSIRGFTPFESGLLLMPGSLVMGLMGIFTGKLFDRVGIKPLAIIGISLMTAVTYLLSKLSLDTPYLLIMALYAIRSFGMAFVMMPITSAGLATISKELIPHATALQNTLRQVAASIGTAVLIVVMTDEAKSYIKSLGSAVDAQSGLLASIHGVDYAFLVATIFGVAALLLSLLFKDKRNPSTAKQEEHEAVLAGK